MNDFLVLIIEDNFWLGEHYVRLIEQAGWKAVLCDNALDGIDRLDDLSVDVVVMDIFLAGPNGIALLHEMQSHADLNLIPVILVTNAADRLDLGNLSPYGVREVLDKVKMVPEDLVAAIQRVA